MDYPEAESVSVDAAVGFDGRPGCVVFPSDDEEGYVDAVAAGYSSSDVCTFNGRVVVTSLFPHCGAPRMVTQNSSCTDAHFDWSPTSWSFVEKPPPY